MIRRPPRSTRTDTLFPYTTLFRSQIDILTPIITAVTASLNGAKLGELSLPETKYVLRDVQFGRHLADGPERIRRFFRSVHKPCSRQQLFTSSRSSWLARKVRSEEHTSELQSLMRISYAVFCLKKK